MSKSKLATSHKVDHAAPVAVPPAAPKTLMEQVKTNMTRVEQAFKSDPLFRVDPAEVETGTAIAAWAMLDTIAEMVEARKAQYRLELLARTEKEGVPTAKGGQHMRVDDNEVIREKRQEKLPAETDFRLMLATKGIPFTEAFDEVKTLKMNPSKVDFLIETGRLSQVEVDELRKVSWALKVKRAELVDKVLEDFSNLILGLPTGTKRLKSER